jgi:hypothetical protein
MSAVFAWVRWIRPSYRSAKADFIAARDAVVGRDAVVDTITGRTLAPALPGVGVRLDKHEQQMDVLTNAVAKIADSHVRLEDHEARIAKLEARRASYAGQSSGGPWAIPWPIVQCESGGTNTPPNWAGASGYYQITPATWRLFGGSGPAAYLAPKAEQDRVAARIWNGGAGAGNWDCAALVAF